MRVIPVLDLAGGLAVHARAGERERYAPLRSLLAPGAPGDARAVARAYRERLGATELYVADLDAIQGGEGSGDASLLGELTAGALVWLDAGIGGEDDLPRLSGLSPARVIVALETVRGVDGIGAVVERVGGERVALSLDLRDGAPLARSPELAVLSPLAIARRGVERGVRSLVVIDLARVGMGRGVDEALLGELRRALPEVELVAGGGVRGAEDLRRLAAVGVDAALVGSALHDGRVDAATLAALARER